MREVLIITKQWILPHDNRDLLSLKCLPVRLGFKYSKWKFNTVFAMEGGRGGGLEFHLPILKNDFLKTI